MDKDKIFIGPTLGNPDDIVLYCLDSDESSMITPESELTEQAKVSDEEYIRNNSTFILSMLANTKPDDHIILDEKFKEAETIVSWLQGILRSIGLTPTTNIHYAKPKTFAKLATDLIGQYSITIVSTICFSHHLNQTFNDEEHLAASIKINSKTYLRELSETYNFSIPTTISTTVKDINPEMLQVLNFPENPIYLKLNGLGGGYNIKRITTKEELKDFLQNVDQNTETLLQRAIGSDFIETISTYKIFPDSVERINTRVKMVADNTWYGNIYLPDLKLSNNQETNLDNAAKAVGKVGYNCETGMLVGFDAFINHDEVYITEINGRYLGSTPPEQLLIKLGLLGKTEVVSSFDYISEDEVEKYKQFARKHLYKESTSDFSIIPLSFSAYVTNNQRVVYYIIVGNFESFCTEVKKEFTDNSFVMTDNSKDIYIKTKNKLEKIKK